MILGIGVDLCRLSRITALLQRGPAFRQRFTQRILHPVEWHEFQALTQGSDPANDKASSRLQLSPPVEFDPSKTPAGNVCLQEHLVRYLATRWAAKEAVYKALYPTHSLSWKDVAVAKRSGKPYLHFQDPSKHGINQSHLSISHDGDLVIAQVVLEA
ncbi:hypothetical protein H4R34_004527 [Dimargaris verticillata]|uniref:4'-phosphopantetheinyl transferase domain-containing protein n=1 Tax=Dimargaris verticillata TaxID=2761393 RepID=A0A9W8B2E4_9FUNG|nr:hypothetical protein H4R34_004527 [Dimargaris verticillata]